MCHVLIWIYPVENQKECAPNMNKERALELIQHALTSRICEARREVIKLQRYHHNEEYNTEYIDFHNKEISEYEEALKFIEDVLK
jgi:hypothetical protein